VKLETLTMKYVGGEGGISKYQGEKFASCGLGPYPEVGTITVGSNIFNVKAGRTLFTLAGDFKAETDFTIKENGNINSLTTCFIHTSCSAPIVAGDTIGPFEVLQTEHGCLEPQGQTAQSEECPIVPYDEECFICDSDVKVKPVHLTLEYTGGPGQVSKYQSEKHASCRNQVFPDETTISFSGRQVEVKNGTRFEIGVQEQLGAETYFTFGDASGTECHIHTSCSAPLKTSDRIGPFKIIGGNNCCASKCGDGIVDDDETCDPADSSFVPDIGMGECRKDCTYCGDGIVNGDEDCDEGAAMPSMTCNACKAPKCGDGLINGEETCDPTDPSFVPASAMGECREDCTYCGDGIINGDEECDEGSEMPSATCKACKPCVCEANGEFDPVTGSVTIDFDFCADATPRFKDFIGIYPCNETESDVREMTEDWIQEICESHQGGWMGENCTQIMKDPDIMGYEVGRRYAFNTETWESYTCGAPGDECYLSKHENETTWPSKGTVTLDPNTKNMDTRWAFGGGKVNETARLEEGCYKVVINRHVTDKISAPPYPNVCEGWDEAQTFDVSY